MLLVGKNQPERVSLKEPCEEKEYAERYVN